MSLLEQLRSPLLAVAAIITISGLTSSAKIGAQTARGPRLTVSVSDGDWNDAATWSNGVPGTRGRVIISENTTVSLGGVDHVAGEVIVHGTLNVPEGMANTESVTTETIRSSTDGVAIHDSATGSGYLLYSAANTRPRFGVGRNNNRNVVAVRFQGEWEFSDDSGWVAFTPEAGDRLLAEVDFDSDTVVSLEGRRGQVRGVDRGYGIGDLSYVADQTPNRVVFVNGDSFSFSENARSRRREIANQRRGVAVDDAATGSGYLMHTVESTQSRFGLPNTVNSNVVAVRNFRDQWQFNNDSRWNDFSRTGSDRLIAAVNFTRDTVRSLRGSLSVTDQIQTGFVAGDITFEANRFSGRNNPGEFTVNGAEFLAGRFSNGGGNGSGVDKTLSVRFIHVNGDGVFRIGSERNRYDNGTFTVTLNGIEPDSAHSIPMANGSTIELDEYDGFVIAEKGGRLQFFGEDRLSYTELSATADAGDSSIRVANVIERNWDGDTSAASDGAMVFKAGDEIVIASSSEDYKEEDVRTIVSVSNNGANSRIELDRPLSHRHYGEIERYGNSAAPGTTPRGGQIAINMRAQVVLLSRNVVFTGLQSQDTDNEFGDRASLITTGSGRSARTVNGIGGHIIVFGSSGQTGVDGIQLDLMGQAGRSGRYPIHWYLGGDRSNDFIRNSSVTNSNNRGIVVHGTDNLLIQGVALHDIHGHGFFTQSGVEVGNRFLNNIALGIHRVGTSRMRDDPFIVDVHDETPNRNNQFASSSAFWMTSADNIYVGNVSAGAEGSGFWFAPVAEAERPPSAEDFAKSPPELVDIYNRNPLELTIGTFERNTAHSSELGLVIAEITQAGFRGDPEQQDRLFGGDNTVLGNVGLINDFTVYMTSTGFYSRPDEMFVDFQTFRAADNRISFWDTIPATITNALFVGHSRGNSQSPQVSNPVAFFKYFDQLALADLHFANFGVERNGSTAFPFRDGGARNQYGTTARGFTYEDASSAQSVASITGGGTVPATVRPILDLDGSLTGHIGGGAGYTLTRYSPFWFNGQDGDRTLGGAQTPGQFTTAITRKEFASFHLSARNEVSGRDNVRLRITSPEGVTNEFGGVLTDEARNSAGNTPFLNNPRVPLIPGREYTIEPVRPYDVANNAFKFAYFDWVAPENSLSNVVRFVGGADEFTPTFSVSGNVVPSVGSLRELRAATEDTFFRAGNGDLYMKMFNATADTAGAIDSNVYTMVPF